MMVIKKVMIQDPEDKAVFVAAFWHGKPCTIEDIAKFNCGTRFRFVYESGKTSLPFTSVLSDCLES